MNALKLSIYFWEMIAFYSIKPKWMSVNSYLNFSKSMKGLRAKRSTWIYPLCFSKKKYSAPIKCSIECESYI